MDATTASSIIAGPLGDVAGNFNFSKQAIARGEAIGLDVVSLYGAGREPTSVPLTTMPRPPLPQWIRPPSARSPTRWALSSPRFPGALGRCSMATAQPPGSADGRRAGLPGRHPVAR